MGRCDSSRATTTAAAVRASKETGEGEAFVHRKRCSHIGAWISGPGNHDSTNQHGHLIFFAEVMLLPTFAVFYPVKHFCVITVTCYNYATTTTATTTTYDYYCSHCHYHYHYQYYYYWFTPRLAPQTSGKLFLTFRMSLVVAYPTTSSHNNTCLTALCPGLPG